MTGTLDDCEFSVVIIILPGYLCVCSAFFRWRWRWRRLRIIFSGLVPRLPRLPREQSFWQNFIQKAKNLGNKLERVNRELGDGGRTMEFCSVGLASTSCDSLRPLVDVRPVSYTSKPQPTATSKTNLWPLIEMRIRF